MFHKKRDPKFIDSQNFYFHFHYKLFCIKAVHLSNKASLMCHRLWPTEDICIGLYVLKCLLNVWYILEKVMSKQHSFEEFSEKQRRVELRSVGHFVVKAVLVESANQFSLEKVCRTHYNLNYFSKPYRPSDPLKKKKPLIKDKKFICRKYLLCSNEVPLDYIRNMFLEFMVIDFEYIVKTSRCIVKHVFKVILYRFVKVRHKFSLITIWI